MSIAKKLSQSSMTVTCWKEIRKLLPKANNWREADQTNQTSQDVKYHIYNDQDQMIACAKLSKNSNDRIGLLELIMVNN